MKAENLNVKNDIYIISEELKRELAIMDAEERQTECLISQSYISKKAQQ